MRFYTRQHRHYCGVDLHARTMYICVLNGAVIACCRADLSTSPRNVFWPLACKRQAGDES
jgi:hypothetical protein